MGGVNANEGGKGRALLCVGRAHEGVGGVHANEGGKGRGLLCVGRAHAGVGGAGLRKAGQKVLQASQNHGP